SVCDSIMTSISKSFSEKETPLFIERFTAEIEDALYNKSDRCILPTLATVPRGQEKGRFLAIDVGGSTLRIGAIELLGHSEYSLYGSWSWHIGNGLKTINGEFFEMIADCILEVVTVNARGFFGDVCDGNVIAGLSWSFPITQTDVRNAFVTVVSKGFQLSDDIFGRDIVPILTRTLVVKHGLRMDIRAVTNDAVTVFIAARYMFNSSIGLVLGTGINASFLLKDTIVNSELSFFGSHLCNLASSEIDLKMFEGYHEVSYPLHMSLKFPLVQPLEYMSSGRYLGEMFRIGLRSMIESEELFCGQLVPETLSAPYQISGEDMCNIYEFSYEDSRNLVDSKLNLSMSESDYNTISSFIDVLISRAANLVASSLISCFNVIKRNSDSQSHTESGSQEQVTIGYVGSLLEKFYCYRTKLEETLEKCHILYDTPRFKLVHIDNSTLVGAAIAAA
ncbi:hypothetical protein CANARDRAFT_181622, partial [[Candida] arabinofermentans NRRL YB-2248]